MPHGPRRKIFGIDKLKFIIGQEKEYILNEIECYDSYIYFYLKEISKDIYLKTYIN